MCSWVIVMNNLPANRTGKSGVLPFLPCRFATLTIVSLALSVSLAGVADAQAPAPPVKTERVHTAPVIRKLELSGTVTAPQVSKISTAVDGIVTVVNFDSGARVNVGTVLLELDSEIETAAFKQAEAQVRKTAAEVADAKRRLRIAQRLATRSFGTKNEVEARQAELNIDEAAHESSRAEQERRAAILQRHRVKAPFSGVITKKLAEIGQWVEPGTAVFELVAMQKQRIDVPVPQDYYAQLRQGADVAVTFDTIPGEVVPARIDALIPLSDPNSRTFTLRVLPQRDDLAITPGMSATVVINIKTSGRDIVVSRDALIRYPDGRVTVWVLEKKGKAALVRERRVEIGLAFDGVIQVTSGLKEGEQVVVRGNEALRDGQTVRPIS